MTVKLLTKPQTQQIIRDLRAAGYPIRKPSEGHYRLALKSGRVLFEALIGHNGYLVTYDDQLLTPQTTTVTTI